MHPHPAKMQQHQDRRRGSRDQGSLSSSRLVHLPQHPCSISSCPGFTTSPALSPCFIPVLTSCFPPTNTQPPFTSKQAIHLCRVHREILQKHREQLKNKHQLTQSQWTQEHTRQHSNTSHNTMGKQAETVITRADKTAIERVLVSCALVLCVCVLFSVIIVLFYW